MIHTTTKIRITIEQNFTFDSNIAIACKLYIFFHFHMHFSTFGTIKREAMVTKGKFKLIAEIN